MPRILSVSSSRADVGVLTPVWRSLAARPNVELHVLLTGMHCDSKAAPAALPKGVTVHRGGDDLGGGKPAAAVRGMVSGAAAMAALLDSEAFDCVLLIGDRLDMLPAAFAALPYNIPLAHLHGGELTFGALDERTRHALTKLSHLHFVSCTAAAERLVRMGEEPWRVNVTGAPGLDTLADAPMLSAGEVARRLQLPFEDGFVLVTVHPETNAKNPALPMQAVLGALDRAGARALITAPNADPGGQELRAMIDRFIPSHPQVAFRDTLGSELYPNVLRHAVAMVGNSSSGLIEAGFFGLPVIDVGDRQQGRPAGANVRHAASDAAVILDALRPVLATRPRYPAGSPYGDGRSAERIAAALAQLPDRWRLLRKTFHDGPGTIRFTAPWDQSGSLQERASVS